MIKTLRFLSALEDMLDDLGPQIYTCLGRANSLEVNRGAGSSMSLVDDQNVYRLVHMDYFSLNHQFPTNQSSIRLLHSAQEKLDRKMRSGAIPERFQQVSRVSLDNATILLQRSKCKKEDIAEMNRPEPPMLSASSSSRISQPPSMDVPDPMEITVKAAIAKSVAEQFRRAGRYVTAEELSKIVDAEYTRVREQLPSEVMKEQQQERPSAHQPLPQAPAATPFGNLNVDWGALKTAVSSVKPPEPASQNPGYFTGAVCYKLDISKYTKKNCPRLSDLAPTAKCQYMRKHATLDKPFQGTLMYIELQVPLVTLLLAHFADNSSKKEKEVVSAAAANDGQEESVAATNDASDFDDLTLEDLSALFKNFQQLDEDNRTSLIEYMKRLEKTNPTRVRQLKHHIHSNR